MPGTEVKIHAALPVDGWDPLAPTDDDANVFAAAQKREIRNILKSYTGYYDLFSEMIQNALDAVEKRSAESEPGYAPSILIQINIHDNFVCITDNGCSMSLAQLKKFLKPSISFKDGPETRGSKGVGATYLAFGFNHLEVAAKHDGSTVYAGIFKSGRTWLEDTKGIVTKPNVESVGNWSDTLAKLDRGTSIRLKLVGDNIRPKSLQYFIAKNAEQWSCLTSSPYASRRRLSLWRRTAKSQYRNRGYKRQRRGHQDTIDLPQLPLSPRSVGEDGRSPGIP